MEKRGYQKEAGYNTLSIIGFILAFIVPFVGFILGIIALSQIKKTNEKGRGLAIASIVLGAVFFLFLILIVFVGLSWILIRNTVMEQDNSYGGFQQDIDSMCFESNVEVTRVIKNSATDYTVTLTRNGGGGDLGGVKLVFTATDVAENYVADVAGNIEPLMDKTTSVTVSNLANPNKVLVVTYFLDSSGNPQLCSTANEFTLV